jgi:hypothetical protein
VVATIEMRKKDRDKDNRQCTRRQQVVQKIRQREACKINIRRPARTSWPDWFAPETRIWADAWNMGAVYTPDGMLIQFDNGTIWERDLGLPPPPPPPRRRQ